MVLIGELVKALNLYTNPGFAHHSNMNNNSNARVASKRSWMQKVSLFDMILMLHLYILCDHSSWLFSFSLFLRFALHNIYAFHAGLFLLILFKIYNNKKKGKGRKNVFCIIFLGFEIKVGHIIFT